MKRTEQQSWFLRFEGYILIPHELLHITGYWLVGKACQYQWGNRSVRPIGPMTRWQKLVGLLFPFVMFAVVFLVCGVLSGLAYSQALRNGTFFWFIFWTGLAFVAGIYAGTAITDLRTAYLLIFDKPWYSWTPFDIFFWPIVDWEDVRERVATLRQNDDEQS